MSSRQVTTNCSHDDPESLFDLAMSVVVTATDAVVNYGWPKSSPRADHGLPIEVLERYLAAYQEHRSIDDDVARQLCEGRCKLRSVKLNKAQVTDRGIGHLLGVKPREVELVDCRLVTPDSLRHISDNSENLVSLKLVHTNVMGQSSSLRRRSPACVFNAPVLRRLIIRQRGLEILAPPSLTPLDALVYLDLSDCKSVAGLPSAGLRHLETLILHGVPALQTIVVWILSLSKLRVLDVSQSNDRLGKFNRPNAVLADIISSLPQLTHLDISGTNLAGSGTVRTEGSEKEWTEPVRCDVPGLVKRVERPLQFLGLYGTHYAACKRHDIPALVITGDANEEQVLTAAAAYMERPEVLTRVLNDLYFLFRYEDNRQVVRALNIVLEAMARHINEKTVQISGSATLFYIIKDKQMQNMSPRVKRRIISALLHGMEAHMDDETMMRNGCLGLTRFSIPSDVLFKYQTMAQVLLEGVLDQRLEDFVRRMGIYLLNSLACQVDTLQKNFLGMCGAIQKMLDIISERLEVNTCDTMLEMAWSTLWNMTDEMPSNCERFLDLNGLDLFLACLESFPNKDDQLRNMMGLLGNVAENPPLRKHLMTPQLLKVFYELLNSSRDGIEVSYNAGGVLAHIASDGPGVWTATDPPRPAVMERLSAAIERWDLKADRNINYRSFRPILSLLHAQHTPECQHWAAWALANLTTVYPDKYCKLIVSEGGMDLLKFVYHHEETTPCVKRLCALVVDNVHGVVDE